MHRQTAGWPMKSRSNHQGRVQYPMPQQMTPLGPEILEAAETEEEKKAHGAVVELFWIIRSGS